jgi:hypothetical protein
LKDRWVLLPPPTENYAIPFYLCVLVSVSVFICRCSDNDASSPPPPPAASCSCLSHRCPDVAHSCLRYALTMRCFPPLPVSLFPVYPVPLINRMGRGMRSICFGFDSCFSHDHHWQTHSLLITPSPPLATASSFFCVWVRWFVSVRASDECGCVAPAAAATYPVGGCACFPT